MNDHLPESPIYRITTTVSLLAYYFVSSWNLTDFYMTRTKQGQ